MRIPLLTTTKIEKAQTNLIIWPLFHSWAPAILTWQYSTLSTFCIGSSPSCWKKLLLKIFAKLDPINLNYFSVKSKRFLVFAPKYKNTPETSSEPRGDAQYCGVFWRSFPADHVVSLVSIEEQVGWYCQQYCRNIARKQSATRLVWVFLSRSRKRVHFLNPIIILLLACCFDPF